MQFKVAAFTTVAVATLAAATVIDMPSRRTDGSGPSNQCNTGPIQCCNSVQPASTPSIATLLVLLGIVVSDVTALVGVNCSPVSVIGIGGNSCSSQPVCCTNNSFNGVVAIGCSPINVNL